MGMAISQFCPLRELACHFPIFFAGMLPTSGNRNCMPLFAAWTGLDLNNALRWRVFSRLGSQKGDLFAFVLLDVLKQVNYLCLATEAFIDCAILWVLLRDVVILELDNWTMLETMSRRLPLSVFVMN